MDPRRLLKVALIAISLVVSGCSLGEAVLPNPTPLSGPAAPHAEVTTPIPDPIPHSLAGRSECFACHATGAVDAPPVPKGHPEVVSECTSCHAVWTQPGIAAIAPPAISHEVDGRADCLTCHKIGTASAPRIPSNHAGLPSTLCRSCHLGGGEIAETKPESVGLAPPIPHGRQGFEACTTCHEQGAAGAPQFPLDHSGRTDDICSACHSSVSSEPISASNADATEESSSPAAEGSIMEGTEGVAEIPAIPHPVEGYAACTLCHEQGSATVPQFPPDHSGRSVESCTACHQP
jgi:hypothetical protein